MDRYFLGCMHEQYDPRELLEQAVAGERACSDGIACSDHFQPSWEPGHSGQAWIWLGAAAAATEWLPIGPAATVAHQSGPNALEAIRVYGEQVLPSYAADAVGPERVSADALPHRCSRLSPPTCRARRGGPPGR
jgi:hypothetical protein